MSGLIKNAGNWKVVTQGYVKVGGSWRSILSGYAKQAGVWYPIFGGSAPLVAITGVEIGEVIISGEDVWHDSNDVPRYDLLLADGSAVSGVTHSELSSIFSVLPNLPTIEGSPFPNKVVADYTGGAA